MNRVRLIDDLVINHYCWNVVVKYPLQTNVPAVINYPLCLPVHCSLVKKVNSLAPPIHTFRGRDSCSFIVFSIHADHRTTNTNSPVTPSPNTQAAVCSYAVWSLGTARKGWGITLFLGNSCAVTDLICAVNHKATQSSCLSVNQCNLHSTTFTLYRSLFSLFFWSVFQPSVILNCC